MHILLIGSPGSGKGTQSSFLVSKKSFKHLSTGDLFRNILKKDNPLAEEIKSYLSSGELVPDSITIRLVEENLKSNEEKSFIFDGFPRNLSQAEALNEMLKQRGEKIDHVFYLEVPDKVAVERLTGRRCAPRSGEVYHIKYNPPKKEGYCDKSNEALVIRPDDKEEVVLDRLKVFGESTKPLLDYYEGLKILRKISGDLSSEKVFQEISKFL